MIPDPIDLPELDGALAAVGKDGSVILTFSNQGYLPILENWLLAMARLDIRDILVVALDGPTHAWLSARGVVTVLLPCADDLQALWRRRVALFAATLRRGYNLLHSDADAVWLRDPRPEYFAGSAADVVFSQATQWPTDVYRDWSFTLCCGLFFLRATDPVQALMSDWMAHVAETGDDQVSFNRLLHARGLAWEIVEPYRIPTPFGVDITCSRQLMRARAGDLNVEVLPQHLFQRVHFPAEEAYVKHCLSGQTAQTTREGLAATGCWLLPAEPGAAPPD